MRLPKKRRANGRSACPHCHHTLAAIDLVPLVSYIMLGGRCRYCHKPISSRYVFIELVTGLLFLSAFLAIGPTNYFGYAVLGRSLFCIAVFVVVFVIDFEHFLILDRVVLPATAVVLASNFLLDLASGSFGLHSPTVTGLIAGMVGFGLTWLLWRISRGKWIGLGDAKLLLFLGVTLLCTGLLVGYFVALALGTAVSIVLLATGKKTMKSPLPFGTFLVIGGYISLLYGQSIWNWYTALLGL